ncbi:MAG TPA: methyltransferase domain-containing protein, partial [Casimicrobiaceae bacterium]|nr:methyltransferase domain-containing protein [Casimicrobiaceae bacterium]
MLARYRPEVFDVPDEAAARAIILTPEGGTPTETRWERETPYLARLAVAELQIVAGMRVIDYGCGIGRLARELIAKTHCNVVGVDVERLSLDASEARLHKRGDVDSVVHPARVAGDCA